MESIYDNHSVLDDLGAEVTGIAYPVSICMAITIFLVRLLQTENDNETRSVVIAEVIRETEDETAGSKLRGSLINAIVFVAIVTVMTFVIVLLFKYGCVKLIYGYMGFATFMIFFIMTGGIALDLLQTLKLRMDILSLMFILYNFAVVGSTILFFTPAPLLLKQVYLMWTGVVVAYIFTSIPEWTTWVLLVAMALYDLFAVLTPSGPLQMLVNLAMERDEDIPALVYEAREVRRPRRRNAAGSEAQAVAEGRTAARSGARTVFTPDSEAASDHLHSGGRLGAAEGHWGSGSSTSNSRGAYRGGRALGESQEGRPARQMGQGFGQIVDSELARLHRPPDAAVIEQDPFQGAGVPVMENGPQDGLEDTMVAPEDATESLLAATEPTSHASTPGAPGAPPSGAPPAPETMTVPRPTEQPEADEQEEGQGRRLRRRQVQREDDEVEDPYELGIPASVKLGLGDFIFYSVLVGRASLYDWLTVYSSFIGVIAGLGITLWLLAVAKKALPALPVSIALGIVFYFLTRATLEAFVVPPFVSLVSW